MYSDACLISELIELVYNLNLEGQAMKLPLAEKLTTFKIVKWEENREYPAALIALQQPLFYCGETQSSLSRNPKLSILASPIPLFNVIGERAPGEEENAQLPSILFIIGLFLGDGSLYFSFNAPKTITPKFDIKIVCEIVGCKDTEYNKHLINLVSKSLGLKNNIYIKNSTNLLSLRYTGKTVFNEILPILEANKQWLFWKESQLSLALTVKQVYLTKNHLTKEGLTQLVNVLYCAPNGYKNPLSYWLKLIDLRKWK